MAFVVISPSLFLCHNFNVLRKIEIHERLTP